MTIINSHQQWLVEYKKDKSRLWIKVCLSSGEELYFSDYNIWFEVKQYIQDHNLLIEEVKLQYRSNIVVQNCHDSDGVYLVRSVIGRPGEDTIQTMTIGVVIDGIVHKKIWIIPSLMKIDEYSDDVSECFKEALLLWQKS